MIDIRGTTPLFDTPSIPLRNYVSNKGALMPVTYGPLLGANGLARRQTHSLFLGIQRSGILQERGFKGVPPLVFSIHQRLYASLLILYNLIKRTCS
jgi:hypothetical protein